MNTNQKAIRAFLLLVIAISATLDTFIIRTGASGLIVFLMFVPAISALVTKFVYFKGQKGLLLVHKFKWQYALYAVLIPLVYLGIPYIIYWLMKPGSMQITWNLKLIITALVMIVVNLVPAFGEELGWRGFLFPRLSEEIGSTKAILFTSLIWGLWHCPLLISGLYMPGTPVLYKIPMFLLMTLCLSTIMCITTLRTKSIWPAVIMHSAHNVIDQAIFGEGTIGADKMYFVSETGVFTLAIIAAIAMAMFFSYKNEQKALDVNSAEEGNQIDRPNSATLAAIQEAEIVTKDPAVKGDTDVDKVFTDLEK